MARPILSREMKLDQQSNKINANMIASESKVDQNMNETNANIRAVQTEITSVKAKIDLLREISGQGRCPQCEDGFRHFNSRYERYR